MGWQMIGKPTTQIADHQLVERFKTMTRFGGDRLLSKARCTKLRSLLEEGKFRTCAWAVCKCLADGKEYRINGQHTSHVLAEFNGSLPAVFVTVERYEADTLEDVAELFATFDPRWSTRTTTDTNHAYAQSNAILASLPPRIINLTGTALAAHHKLFNHKMISQELRGRLIGKNAAFAQWLNNLEVSSNQKAHLHRGNTMAAMYATFLVDQDCATKFWSEVRDGSGATPSAPTRMLEIFLLKSSAKSDDNEVYAKCIHAWNSYRNGVQSLGVLKWYPAAPRPEPV